MFDNHQLYGLAFGCPYLERIDNCPLKHVDELTNEERYYWIYKLRDEDKRKILNFHIYCSLNRT